MAKRQVNLEGVTMTGQYLTIHFTTGDRAAKRLEQVKVPWGRLLDTPIYEHLNRAEVIRLKTSWEGAQAELPPW